MVDWFDERYGGDDSEWRSAPSIEEILQVVSDRVRDERTPRIRFSDGVLEKIDLRLAEEIHAMKQDEGYLISRDRTIRACMYAIVVGGGFVKKKRLEDYKSALEKYNIDLDKGIV